MKSTTLFHPFTRVQSRRFAVIRRQFPPFTQLGKPNNRLLATHSGQFEISVSPARMSMKAAVLYQPGGPEALKVEQRPIPSAGQGWVLIKVHAFGLNRSELFTRQGHSPGVKFPRILGIEATGVIEDPSDSSFSKGDVVATAMGGMGRSFDGGYAEYVTVPASQVQKLHTKLPWETLGALAEMLQTAYGSLYNALQCKPGETLLIRGGTTSVGLAAAAIARSRGVHVIATTRNASRKPLLEKSGVHDIVIDDGSIAKSVQKLTDGGVNKVLELIGTITLLDSLQCVKPHGIVCMTGIVGNSWSLKDFAPMEAIPATACLTVYTGGPAEFINTPLQELVEQIEAGDLPVSVGQTFKLDEIVEAHRCMEENRAGGKIVVLP